MTISRAKGRVLQWNEELQMEWWMDVIPCEVQEGQQRDDCEGVMSCVFVVRDSIACFGIIRVAFTAEWGLLDVCNGW